MTLTKYTEDNEITAIDGEEFAEDDDTMKYPVFRDDAIWEARERMRLGNHEAAGVWLVVAGGMSA